MDQIQVKKFSSKLEEENYRLRITIQELSILNEISSTISSTLSLEKVIELIIKKCIKHLHVEQCSISLIDIKADKSDFRTMVRHADETHYNQAYRLNDQLTGWMILNKRPLTINNTRIDKRVNINLDDYKKISSLITVPLISKGELIGSLNVFNKRDGELFESGDERLLSIIATQSAGVIENARLLEEEKKLKVIEEELKLAREIQLNLLPKSIPEIPGFEIAALSIPAKEVGGDYYDFIQMDKNKTAFCLGDVTGKGLPAAMLVANVQATLRGQLLFGRDLKDCLERSNTLLFNSTDATKFVTLFLASIDSETNSVAYSNCGHDHPILIKSKREIQRLKTGGLLLGCFPQSNYQEEIIEMQTNDILLINSDGVTEAHSTNNELYGEERLIEILLSVKHENCGVILDKIIHSINAFTTNTRQFDDITMIALKKL